MLAAVQPFKALVHSSVYVGTLNDIALLEETRWLHFALR